jgi:2-haloacid dehalogenase
MYGTVANLDAVTRACAEFAEDPAEFGSLWRSKQLEYTFLLSLMDDYVDFWEATLMALEFAIDAAGEKFTKGQKDLLMNSWLRPEAYEDAYEGLQKLKRHFPLAILSNGSPKMLREGLKFAALDGFFDKILSVEKVRVFKPSPKVYELAPTELKVSKEKILFVSSNSFDVVGARKYGFHTCWIRRTEQVLDPLGEVPDHIVSSFEELASLTFEDLMR